MNWTVIIIETVAMTAAFTALAVNGLPQLDIEMRLIPILLY